MKICNFGSLNIDHVYGVDHITRPQETLTSRAYATHLGGKGFNQSIALARAGAVVYHAGCIGADGTPLKEYMERAGVNTDSLAILQDCATGHAIIQVDKYGQNSILVYGGANQKITDEMIFQVLSHFGTGDFMVLQNEINQLPAIIQQAHDRGMKIVFNPSPITEEIGAYPLQQIDYFVVNEIEGQVFTGVEDSREMLAKFAELYPGKGVILTLGSDGSAYLAPDGTIYYHGIYDTPVADTTGAGDTFLGFCVAGIAREDDPAQILKNASAASAIAVTRPGAAQSVPTMKEVTQFLLEHNNE